MEGFLLKKGRAEKGFGRRNWKQRWFVLTSEHLQCYESFDVKTLTPIHLKFSISIIGAELSPTIHHSKEYTFFIRTRDDPIPLYLKADNSFSFNLWMKELSAAVEGKQTLRALSLQECFSAIGIKEQMEVDARILEHSYKETLRTIQTDNTSEDEKIGRATAITAIYSRLLALYTEQEIRKQSETIEYTVTIAKLLEGPEGIGIIFQEHPITNTIKVKNVSGTICVESIHPENAETVREGDILLELNGSSISPMTLSIVLQRLNDFILPTNSKASFKFCRFIKKMQLRSTSPNLRQGKRESKSPPRQSPNREKAIETTAELQYPVKSAEIDDNVNLANNIFTSTNDENKSPCAVELDYTPEPDCPIIAVIHINGEGGSVMDITIRENDVPQQLAEKFVALNGLNNMLVPMLVQEIQKSIINAQNSDQLQDIDPDDEDPNNNKHMDREFTTDSEILGIPSEITFLRAISPHDIINGSVESGNELDHEIDMFSQSSPLTEEYTHSEYSYGKMSNNNTMLALRELSAFQNGDNNIDEKGNSHKSVYHRLYENAAHIQNKKEILRQQIEEERYQNILATSFRANKWKTDGFSASRHDDSWNEENFLDSHDNEALNDFVSNGDDVGSPTDSRRPRAESRSLSPSISRQHGANVFERLYAYAEKFKNHKEHLRKNFEETRLTEVLGTSFRSLNENLKVPPSQTCKMFEDHMAWVRSRDRHLDELQKRLAMEKEKAVLKELTFSPRLAVSKHMSLPRSKSAEKVFEHLYEQRITHDVNREKLVEKNSTERLRSFDFRPKISARSQYLAAKRLIAKQKLTMESLDGNDKTESPSRQPRELLQRNCGGQSPVEFYMFHEETDRVPEDVNLNANLDKNKSDLPTLTDQQVQNYTEGHLNAEIVDLLKATDSLTTGSESKYQIFHSMGNSTEKKGLQRYIANEISQAVTPRNTFGKNGIRLNIDTVQVQTPQERAVLSRSASPASHAVSSTVFERLYQAKDEMKSNQEQLSKKLKPQFSHNPTINPRRPSDDGQNEEDIFQKLYNYRQKRSQYSIAAKIESHRQDINEESFSRQNYRGYTSPFKPRSITPTQADALVQRLWNSKAMSDEKVIKKKQELLQKMKENTNSNFIHKKSDENVSSMYHSALSEIFDVLLVSADYCKAHEEKKHQDQVPIEAAEFLDQTTESQQESTSLLNDDPKSGKNTALLCVDYANASFLEPKDLSSAMSCVLSTFKSTEKQSPAYITREEFIGKTINLMFDGSLPPIGYILARKVQMSKNSKYWTPSKTTEELEFSQCQDRPTLKARKTTELLVSERHKDRIRGKVSIEDSLISYNSTRQQKLDALKNELEMVEKAECTFQPSLIASSMKEFSRTRQQRFVQNSPHQNRGDGWDNSNLNHSQGQPLHLGEIIDQPRSQYLLHPYLDDADR